MDNLFVGASPDNLCTNTTKSWVELFLTLWEDNGEASVAADYRNAHPLIAGELGTSSISRSGILGTGV